MQVPFVCMWLMIVPAGTKRSPSVGTVLAHSLRRWIGIVETTHWPSVDLVPGRHCRQWTGIESALACVSHLLGDQMTKKYSF